MKAPERRGIIDVDLVRQRRLDLGLSEYQIASDAGVRPSTIRRLEDSEPQADLTVRFIEDLAFALQLPLAKLLSADLRPQMSPTGTDADDAQRAGSLLTRFGEAIPVEVLADALEWPLDRALHAVDVLDGLLRTTGQAVASRDDTVAIVSDGTADPDEVARVARGALRHRGLTMQEAKLLLRVIRGLDRTPHDSSLSARSAFGVLRAGDLVETPVRDWRQAQPVAVTPVVRRSLLLDDPQAQQERTGRKVGGRRKRSSAR